MAETSTGGGGGTMGAGMVTGIMTIPLQANISKKKRKSARLQRRHQELLNSQARDRIKEDIFATEQGNKKDTQAVEESMADRGLGDSSIKADAQTERDVDFKRRRGELERQRVALESGIFTSDKVNDIQKKIASAQNAINMINAVSGGAAGVVDYYGG